MGRWRSSQLFECSNTPPPPRARARAHAHACIQYFKTCAGVVPCSQPGGGGVSRPDRRFKTSQAAPHRRISMHIMGALRQRSTLAGWASETCAGVILGIGQFTKQDMLWATG